MLESVTACSFDSLLLPPFPFLLIYLILDQPIFSLEKKALKVLKTEIVMSPSRLQFLQRLKLPLRKKEEFYINSSIKINFTNFCASLFSGLDLSCSKLQILF